MTTKSEMLFWQSSPQNCTSVEEDEAEKDAYVIDDNTEKQSLQKSRWGKKRGGQ